jgi:glutathione-independent formaldehyde dehydrogenase
MYECRTDLEAGKMIGHEMLRVIAERGPAVARVIGGDRVCIPCNAAVSPTRPAP